MKRSEMIQLLLKTHEELGPLGMSLERKCEEILTTIEEAGMLPPIHEDVPDDDKEYIGYAMEEFHNWEKEDE